MNFEEFEDHLGRLGEDLMVWPPSARQAGIELLRNSAAAREIMDEAQALRRAMTAVAPVRAPAGLADRIVTEAVRARPPTHEPLAQESLAQESLAHEPPSHEPLARKPLKQTIA